MTNQTDQNLSDVRVTSADFSLISDIHRKIPEFTAMDAASFMARCEGKDHLALTAWCGKESAGYAVCYDRYGDGSLYCWLAGIVPDFRRRGIYTALAAAREQWALDNGYKQMRIKTRNNRREMLHWLVGNGFDFIAVDKRDPIADSRIHLAKNLAPFEYRQ